MKIELKKREVKLSRKRGKESKKGSNIVISLSICCIISVNQLDIIDLFFRQSKSDQGVNKKNKNEYEKRKYTTST